MRKLGVVITDSSEKLHDFETMCPDLLILIISRDTINDAEAATLL